MLYTSEGRGGQPDWSGRSLADARRLLDERIEAEPRRIRLLPASSRINYYVLIDYNMSRSGL